MRDFLNDTFRNRLAQAVDLGGWNATARHNDTPERLQFLKRHQSGDARVAEVEPVERDRIKEGRLSGAFRDSLRSAIRFLRTLCRNSVTSWFRTLMQAGGFGTMFVSVSDGAVNSLKVGNQPGTRFARGSGLFHVIAIGNRGSGMSRAQLKVAPRSVKGTRPCDKLRAQGLVPGNIYGHKQDAQMLTASEDDLRLFLKTGAHVIDLDLGGQASFAVMRSVQWDLLGDHIAHFDLLRVDPTERVVVDVHVELRGTAPGTLAGGVLEHSLHRLSVECPAISIPDHIVVKIGNLNVGQAIHVSDIEPIPDVKILNNPENIVVRVAKAVVQEVLPGEAGGPVQPELIGKKPTEEGAEGDAKKDGGKK